MIELQKVKCDFDEQSTLFVDAKSHLTPLSGFVAAGLRLREGLVSEAVDQLVLQPAAVQRRAASRFGARGAWRAVASPELLAFDRATERLLATAFEGEHG